MKAGTVSLRHYLDEHPASSWGTAERKERRDHRSIDKPIPRLHGLVWLPRRQVKLNPRWCPDQRTGLALHRTTRRARVDDSAIPRELCDRLAERLAADLRRIGDLLGHQMPSHWRWSTSAST